MVFLVFFIFMMVSALRFVIKREWLGILIMVIFVTLGFGRSAAVTDVSPIQSVYSVYTGVVKEVMWTSGGNQRLLVEVDGDLLSHDVLVSVPQEEDEESYAYFVGEGVRFMGGLEYLSRASQPNGFDEWTYYLGKGAGYYMYPKKIQSLGEGESREDIWHTLAIWRSALFDVLDTYLPVEDSGIAKAMLAGDKDYLSDDISSLYEKAGISHILCVSGIHITMFAAYIYFVMERGLKMLQKPLLIVTMGFSVAYLAFTGFAPSSIRAVIMGNMVYLGFLFGRKSDWWNNLAIAALVILLIQPMYLFHAGFQLSFVTVIGLWVGRATKTEDLENLKSKALTSLRSCVFASLFGYPLVAYYFCSISLVGILVNIPVIPIAGALLGVLILLAICGFLLPPLAPFVASGVKAILLAIKSLCLLAESVPNGYILTGSPSLATVCLAYAFLLCVFLLGKRFCNWKTATCLGLALWVSVYGNEVIWKKNTVAFLDVGQGDAIVLSTYDGRAILIDGGGWYGADMGRNTGTYVVLPYLEYLGISKLDGIFVTHLDRENIIGALEILDNVPTEAIYFSPYPQDELNYWWLFQVRIAKNDVLLYTLEEGMKTDWQNGEIQCFYPIPDVSFVDGDEDHGSLVLKYTYGESSVLFTGDITSADEGLLVERQGENLQVNAVQLPSHGSGASGSYGFLDSTESGIGIISCGEDNIYGYPAGNVLDNLRELDMGVYRTDIDGSVLLHMSADGEIQVECAKGKETIYERIEKAMEKWRI